MAIRTRDELMESVKTIIGENTSDETIAFLEDMSDTFTDYDNRVKGDGIDWKAKAEEIDKTWREKYTNRFFNNEEFIDTPEVNLPETLQEEQHRELTKFEDLFTEIKKEEDK